MALTIEELNLAAKFLDRSSATGVQENREFVYVITALEREAKALSESTEAAPQEK